jgi:hypothetical protein
MASDNPNSKAINMNPKLRLQNGVQTKFSCLRCRKNLKLRKPKLRKLHVIDMSLAKNTKNEPKARENLKSRNLKSGFHCIKKLEKVVLIHLTILFWLYDKKDWGKP